LEWKSNEKEGTCPRYLNEFKRLRKKNSHVVWKSGSVEARILEMGRVLAALTTGTVNRRRRGGYNDRSPSKIQQK